MFLSNPINSFDEEDLVTYGCINGFETPIVIDSGARISLISDDFIDIDYEPVKFVNITGISQVPKSVPVFEIPVELPTLTGVCLLAVDSRLPPRTALFGTEFGKSNLLDLIAHVRSNPVPVFTVTRAMQAENKLAEQIAGALHASEGASPLPLDEIAEFDDETDLIETEPVTELVTVYAENNSVTNVIDESVDNVVDYVNESVNNSIESPAEPQAVPSMSPSPAISNSLVPIPIPTLKFDGITRDKFGQLQREDESLAPLWEFARKHEKSFFIVNGLLMCLTTTQNQFSHALLVPTSLRKDVLMAAHDGLGHGGIGATRSLINRYFTWPNMASDIKSYVQACSKCLKFNKSGPGIIPMVEAEIVSQRGEKLAVDIVGPMPKAKGNLRFVFTCMDLASGFPFAVAMKTYTAEETAKALLSIILVLGVPLQVLSDQGSNFLSATPSHLHRKFGVEGVKMSPYHPQSNGKLERFHSSLKAMLSKCIDARQDWPLALDLVLYFFRSIPHSRHGLIPHELLFLKPTPFIPSTLKSLWLSPTSNSVVGVKLTVSGC